MTQMDVWEYCHLILDPSQYFYTTKKQFILNTLYYRINFKHLKMYFSLKFYGKMYCDFGNKQKRIVHLL